MRAQHTDRRTIQLLQALLLMGLRLRFKVRRLIVMRLRLPSGLRVLVTIRLRLYLEFKILRVTSWFALGTC